MKLVTLSTENKCCDVVLLLCCVSVNSFQIEAIEIPIPCRLKWSKLYFVSWLHLTFISFIFLVRFSKTFSFLCLLFTKVRAHPKLGLLISLKLCCTCARLSLSMYFHMVSSIVHSITLSWESDSCQWPSCSHSHLNVTKQFLKHNRHDQKLLYISTF